MSKSDELLKLVQTTSKVNGALLGIASSSDKFAYLLPLAEEAEKALGDFLQTIPNEDSSIESNSNTFNDSETVEDEDDLLSDHKIISNDSENSNYDIFGDEAETDVTQAPFVNTPITPVPVTAPLAQNEQVNSTLGVSDEAEEEIFENLKAILLSQSADSIDDDEFNAFVDESLKEIFDKAVAKKGWGEVRTEDLSIEASIIFEEGTELGELEPQDVSNWQNMLLALELLESADSEDDTFKSIVSYTLKELHHEDNEDNDSVPAPTTDLPVDVNQNQPTSEMIPQTEEKAVEQDDPNTYRSRIKIMEELKKEESSDDSWLPNYEEYKYAPTDIRPSEKAMNAVVSSENKSEHPEHTAETVETSQSAVATLNKTEVEPIVDETDDVTDNNSTQPFFYEADTDDDSDVDVQEAEIENPAPAFSQLPLGMTNDEQEEDDEEDED